MPHSRSSTTPVKTLKRLFALSGTSPTSSCVHASDRLELRSISVRSLKTQKVLIERRLRSREDRRWAFEQGAAPTVPLLRSDEFQ